MKYFPLLILILLLSGCSGSKNDNNPDNIISNDYELNYLSLGISFPPVVDEEQREFTAPLLNELAIKLIRVGEDWSFREASQGEFVWSPLDKRINWAISNGYQILLTIQSNGPDWACSNIINERSCVYNDNAHFGNYVTQLLQRYSNKIYKIQFGNEWQSEWWYAGNETQFTEASNIVYDAIQTYSPTTKFVLGGFSTISLRYLAGCNGAVSSFYDDEGNLYDQTFLEENCDSDELNVIRNRINYVLQNSLYDEIDIHLYDDVDQWDEYYFNILSIVSRPIIVTEFGGPNMNLEPLTESYQAQQLEKYIHKLDSLEISEGYFFTLVDGTTNNSAHLTSGLIVNEGLTKKEAFQLFKNFSTSNP